MRSYLALAISIIASVILYCIFDRTLYLEGESRFMFYNRLPFGVDPVARPQFEGGFMLIDKYGISIAGNGNSYLLDDQEFIISKIVGYCFNNESINVHVKSVDKVDAFIQFSEENKTSNEYKIVAHIQQEPLKLNSDHHTYVLIEEKSGSIEWRAIFRSLSFLLQIIFIFMFLYKSYKKGARQNEIFN